MGSGAHWPGRAWSVLANRSCPRRPRNARPLGGLNRVTFGRLDTDGFRTLWPLREKSSSSLPFRGFAIVCHKHDVIMQSGNMTSSYEVSRLEGMTSYLIPKRIMPGAVPGSGERRGRKFSSSLDTPPVCPLRYTSTKRKRSHSRAKLPPVSPG